MRATSIGIDLGGSKLLACHLDEEGRILHRVVLPTGRGTGPVRSLDLIEKAVNECHAAGGRQLPVGIGFPGLVDSFTGVVHSSVMLDGWHEVPLAARVEERTGCPCVVDNDVNAAAEAELAARGGPPEPAMLLIGVGTGIGGAVAIEGKVWRGASGVAGEIGNTSIDRHGARCWCGRRGCLNTMASGSAIESALAIQPGSLAVALREREKEAMEAVVQAGEALGFGVANAMNLLNPSLVVLYGGIAEIGPPFLEAVERSARAEAFPEAVAACRFELARSGYEAAAVGAALLARRS